MKDVDKAKLHDQINSMQGEFNIYKFVNEFK